jgi:hypothetical protein
MSNWIKLVLFCSFIVAIVNSWHGKHLEACEEYLFVIAMCLWIRAD